jgi:DNA-binding YbaB/EbfC family protein
VLKGLGNLASLVKNFQQIQTQMEQMREQLRHTRVEGSAGGGMVKVEANGQQEVVNCRISPELFQQSDREMIEELVVAATNQALEHARQAAQDAMGKTFEGLQIPGLSEALNRFSGPGAEK